MACGLLERHPESSRNPADNLGMTCELVADLVVLSCRAGGFHRF
jgi:hypothetical protein